MKKLENIFWAVVVILAIWSTAMQTMKYRQLSKNYNKIVENNEYLQKSLIKILRQNKEKDSLLFKHNIRFTEHLLLQTRLIKEKID